MPKQSRCLQECQSMSWKHSPGAMASRTALNICESSLFMMSLLCLCSVCSVSSDDQKGKLEFTILASPSKNVSNCSTHTEAPLGVRCSLVFQFGSSLVDVAAENHDTGTFVNSWHKNHSRALIWWLYSTHRRLWRHTANDVSVGLCGNVKDRWIWFGSLMFQWFKTHFKDALKNYISLS